MAIRRLALERVGPFDVSLEHGGDEQEWQERLATLPPGALKQVTDGHSGTRVMYVAGAGLHHRRSATDARLRPLCGAAFARGKAARRFDAWRDVQPSLGRELVTLVGCLAHVVRRRCPAGLTMVAHSLGRVREALRTLRRTPTQRLGSGAATGATQSVNVSAVGDVTPSLRAGEAASESGPHVSNSRAPDDYLSGESSTVSGFDEIRRAPDDYLSGESSTVSGFDEIRRAPDDFLSGESGTVGGFDEIRRSLIDFGEDTLQTVSGRRRRLDRASYRMPPTRRVLVLGIERPENSELAQRIRAELARSRHDVETRFAPCGDRGKFENLNLLLEAHPLYERDWLLVVDDDIVLPRGFLDQFLFLAERFRLDLAQPAHRSASHAAWQVTRRQPGSVVRETRFVEIGPVTAFAHSTFSTLLPFPDLRMGWGLDLHWAALAREHSWRCGVIDAVSIRHSAAPAASSYSREQALAEARTFLAHRPYLSASEAQQTLATHRRL
jgi:hypothetical protein